MRISLIITVLFVSSVSFSQIIEASVSAYGFGNYVNRAGGDQTKFKESSYSQMASLMYRRSWLKSQNDKIKLEVGLGLTFTQYSGEWEELVIDRLVGGTIIESLELHRYNATMNALGIELTPVIATFWNILELRSGLFLGTNISDTYEDKYGRSFTTDQNGAITTYDGFLDDVPVVYKPSYVLHWNSRVALNFTVKKFSIAPYYQFSYGLSNEGGSIYDQDVNSYRHHFGLTFGFYLAK